jgi:serine/threonine protein phosphatase PrpC
MLDVSQMGCASSKDQQEEVEESHEELTALIDQSRPFVLAFPAGPKHESMKAFEPKPLRTLTHDKRDLLSLGYTCRKGLKPDSANQDNFLVLKAQDISVLCVVDGHGAFGHVVSDLVRTRLPALVARHQSENIRVAFLDGFRKMNAEVQRHAKTRNFDANYSGCTASLVVIRQGQLHCGWVGDSRVVMGKWNEKGEIKASEVSRDHKPERADEKARILASGGEVRKLEHDVPFRVFVKNRNFPGLAMTRSIGDFGAAAAGVICQPEIFSRAVEETDVFLLLCSDGVWEFMSSEEAVAMLAKFPAAEAQAAVEALAEEAWRRWMTNEGGAVVDDITVVVAFLN